MSRAEQGFSLVELLVSLVIVALLSSLMLSGVLSGRRVWERLEERVSAVEQTERAQLLLRTRLERAHPVSRFDASRPFVDFEGETRAVRFVAPPPLAQRPGALRRYQLGLTGAGDLMLVSVSDLSFTPEAAADQVVVLSGVETVDFAYWGLGQGEQSRRWRPDWRFQPTLPELIRVRVAFKAGDRRRWPELLIDPAADVGTACLMDPETGRCGDAA